MGGWWGGDSEALSGARRVLACGICACNICVATDENYLLCPPPSVLILLCHVTLSLIHTPASLPSRRAHCRLAKPATVALAAAGTAAAGALGPQAPLESVHMPRTPPGSSARVCALLHVAGADHLRTALPPALLRVVWQGGRTPFHWAAQKGNAGAVDRLIAARANVDSADEVVLRARHTDPSLHTS